MLVGFVGIGAIVLWSGTAIANKVAVNHMDALTAGVLRSMIAGLLAVGVAMAVRLPLPSSRREIGLLLVSGLASFAAWPMLMSWGLAWTTAGHAALVMALLPVLTGWMGSVVERRRLRGRWWMGIALALAGTVLLVLSRTPGEGAEATGWLGDVIVLVGTVICAAGYVAGGRLSQSLGTWATTFWGLSAALTILVPAFLILAPRTDWSSVDPRGWAAIGYMAILSSLVGYSAWFWALGRGGIARVAPWQFLQPVFSLVLAAMLLGESWTLPLLVSASAILVGTALAQKGARREDEG